jgi:hypothetical protein
VSEELQDLFLVMLYVWLALMVAVAITKITERREYELETNTTYDYNETKD